MAETTGDTLGPVTLEVIRNALPAIANEMAADVSRTSYNMMIYEVRDFCTALLTPDGALVAQNVGGVSHFVADLGALVVDGMAQHGNDFKPGDVIITNHQKVAGQHLNNIVIYMPYFYEGELVMFSMVRAHWIDVGGISTGFGAESHCLDPWQEGLQLDQLKIYEEGKLNELLLKIIRDNIRFPDSSLGDMRSQIAACKLAFRRLDELFDKFGRDTLMAAIKRIFAETEQRCRNVVAQIPDGVYEAESFLDNDGIIKEERLRLHAKVTVDHGKMTIDLSGCTGERKAGINSRTFAGARVAYKALTLPLDSVNEGSFSACEVIIPEGNIMMARYPAPMSGWSTIVPSVVDTIVKALAPAIRDRIPAGHHGLLGGAVVFFGVNPRNGKRFVVQSIEGGGWGGRPHEDGESGSVSICQGDVRNATIESIELKMPVLVEERSLREDSGGAGKHRGGLGIDMRVRNFVEGRWNLHRPRRIDCPPWGIHGGRAGGTGDMLLKLPGEESFTSMDASQHLVPAESVVIVRTGGGGGWGDPLEREPKRVRDDVVEGFVSVEQARRDYAVVVDPRDHALDLAATEQLRHERRMPAAAE
ncbi:MAG: N-methylhydantoinase B/acetone carboxylase, alpha subunit [Rhodospirillales bacterium]|nr:N-methylhydantoinase B/acetone carboxylase, alpha subunit [Rhodospirillales bacterium]